MPKDPNNAYGSAAARQRVLDRVDNEAYARDYDDSYGRGKRANSKTLNDMAAAQAVNRDVARSARRSGPVGEYRDPNPKDIAAESDATRSRLMRKYGVNGTGFGSFKK